MSIAARDLEATRTRLAGIVGQAGVTSGREMDISSAQGEAAPLVVSPADESQTVEIARLAQAEKIPVIVWGAGTKQDVEPIQPLDGIVLHTGGLSDTIELDADNLTVTVGAGKVLDDLQRELGAVKLFLPLDPVDSARATVGGTLAANTSGPNRLLYRTARDLVLGVRVATPLGTLVRAGGKTVKDVAGYDMKKLYIGSWGTLGAITAATFRLLPLPETRATVAMVFPQLPSACAAVSALLASFMRPSSAELLSSGALPASAEQDLRLGPGEYLLAVCVEGAVEDTERQKRDLAELASSHGAREVSILEGAPESRFWQDRKAALAPVSASRPSALIKGSVPLTQVLNFTSAVVALENQGLRPAFAAHAGNGIVYALVAAESDGAEKLAPAVNRLQQLAAESGGFALLQKAASDVVAKVQLWPPRSDYGLMRELKSHLDPNNLWNPARTPGGRI
ncbi:MAG: FAD-binding oxidoreductase [Chloroflexi bacterium]|nr:FAD-binding oxidoreductase [Chloroflexota bacterium]